MCNYVGDANGERKQNVRGGNQRALSGALYLSTGIDYSPLRRNYETNALSPNLMPLGSASACRAVFHATTNSIHFGSGAAIQPMTHGVPLCGFHSSLLHNISSYSTARSGRYILIAVICKLYVACEQHESGAYGGFFAPPLACLLAFVT